MEPPIGNARSMATDTMSLHAMHNNSKRIRPRPKSMTTRPGAKDAFSSWSEVLTSQVRTMLALIWLNAFVHGIGPAVEAEQTPAACDFRIGAVHPANTGRLPAFLSRIARIPICASTSPLHSPDGKHRLLALPLCRPLGIGLGVAWNRGDTTTRSFAWPICCLATRRPSIGAK
jgi:hypothetical protein